MDPACRSRAPEEHGRPLRWLIGEIEGRRIWIEADYVVIGEVFYQISRVAPPQLRKFHLEIDAFWLRRKDTTSSAKSQ
jgi:hypothetical protein